MDGSCHKENCQGVEHYCEHPSHSPIYICDCREARIAHKGHSTVMIDLDYPIECLSKIQERFSAKQKEFVEKEKSIEALLESIRDSSKKLQGMIQKCENVRQGLINPETRLEVFKKYFNSFERRELSRNAKRILSPCLASPFYCESSKEGKLLFLLDENSFQNGRISPEMLRFLKNKDSFTELNLSNSRMGNSGMGYEGAKIIGDALIYSKLTTLNLGGNQIGPGGAKAIASALPHCQLTSLNLTCNEIFDEGARALASALPQCELSSLNLSKNKIGADGVKVVADGLCESQITFLDFSGNYVDSSLVSGFGGYNRINSLEAAKAIANFIACSSLTTLNLGHCDMQKEGVVIVAKALSNSRLTKLTLGNYQRALYSGFPNSVGPEVAIAIANALPQSQLIILNLEQTEIGDQGLKAIADALSQSQLTELYLECNGIGDEGAKAIANALPHSKLTTLRFSRKWEAGLFQSSSQTNSNRIGNEGATAIANALPQSQLTVLGLGCNKVGDEVAKAIANALPQSQLNHLELENSKSSFGSGLFGQPLSSSSVPDSGENRITDEGAKAIADALPQSQLTFLNLRGSSISHETQNTIKGAKLGISLIL